MSLLKTRRNVRLAGTAIASLLLVMTATVVSGSLIGWILLPFWLPGRVLAASMQSVGIFGDHYEAVWRVGFLFNFAICWILLYDLPKLIAQRIDRKRENA